MHTNWRIYGRVGYALLFLTFGVLGTLSVLIRIDSAVIATGTVAVESNRKVVSHLEGGIVDEVLVREGDSVERGQTLFRINDVATRANVRLLQAELASAQGLEARLAAERDHADQISWPPELVAPHVDPLVAQVVSDQTAIFRSRRQSLDGQAAVLNQRIAQAHIEISGIKIAREADEAQLGYIRTELAGVAQLYAKHLTPLSRLMALNREQARLDGEIGRLIADQARSEQSITETQVQISQLERPFQEEVATSLGRARQLDGEARAKLTVAQDMLQRTAVTAPFAGAVQGLRVGGAGQVVKPGEPLLEIVPVHDQLLVHGQFQPADITDLQPGQEVEIRFSGVSQRSMPLILGHLESLSGDHLFDETTHQPYFLGIVSVDLTQLPADLKQHLRAGLPAEIIAATGERSIFYYLVQPLVQNMRKIFNEK